jgi:uncharacterized RDD family membrane protein YckC
VNASVAIHTPDGIELDLPLAGVASRTLAGVLDLILLLGFWAVVSLSLFVGVDVMSTDITGSVFIAVMVFMMFLSYWGYGVFWEFVLRGQTPGKRVLGIRVIRQDGMTAGFKDLLLRNLLRAVDMQPGLCYAVGIFSIMRDQNGRRLGDIVSGTLVVADSLKEVNTTRAGAAWAARAEQGKAHEAVKLPGGSLSARHLAMVEQYLERRSGLNDARREELARRIVGSFKEILGSELNKLAGTDPERVLEWIQELASAPHVEFNPPSKSKGRQLF